MKLMRKYIQYGILLIALMLLHVGMSLCVSDDSVFKEILNNKTIKEHIVWLYMESNGKIFPDTMAAIFTYINPWIWKCIDIGVYLVIAICVNKIFDLKCIWMGCLIPLLFPFDLLKSAGYVATSTNYIWSSAALLTALLPIRYVDELDNRKVLYTFSVVGNIYACNQEQAGAILVTVYALFVGSELYQKQKVNN